MSGRRSHEHFPARRVRRGLRRCGSSGRSNCGSGGQATAGYFIPRCAAAAELAALTVPGVCIGLLNKGRLAQTQSLPEMEACVRMTRSHGVRAKWFPRPIGAL
eukprot:scaffold1_cov402-Prasinococcus_capsulatus_cf.AAC.28